MRCGMRQKIQPFSSQTQPGPKVVFRVLPLAQTAFCAKDPYDTDSPPSAGALQAPGCNAGVGEVVGKRKSVVSRSGGVAAGVLIGLIKLYQYLISPWLPMCCRFEPTCSVYAIEALRVHGCLRGTSLTVWRVLRCQPFCRGGYDPVPPKRH